MWKGFMRGIIMKSEFKKITLLTAFAAAALVATVPMTNVFADGDAATTNGPGAGTADKNLAGNGAGGDVTGFDTAVGKTATAKSTAELEVTPGFLTLDAVPDMHFDDFKISELLS